MPLLCSLAPGSTLEFGEHGGWIYYQFTRVLRSGHLGPWGAAILAYLGDVSRRIGSLSDSGRGVRTRLFFSLYA